MLRLRHLDILVSRDAAPQDRLCEWIGHLALEGEVADSLYSRFGGMRVGIVLEAQQKGDLVGGCAWRQDEGFAFLGPLAVRPDKRSWGLGATLLARAVDDIRADGIRSIESVYPDNNTVCEKLFRNQRFRVIGTEQDEDGAPWTRVERHLKKS